MDAAARAAHRAVRTRTTQRSQLGAPRGCTANGRKWPAKVALDYLTFIQDGANERGASVDHAATVCRAYCDDTGRQSLLPFAEFAEFANSAANAGVYEWGTLLTNSMIKLIKEERYNRVCTVSGATSMVLQLAFDVEVLTASSAKLVKLAERKQKENVSSNGQAISETIVMRRVHEHIIKEIKKLGKNWQKTATMQQLRSWAVVGFRGMIAGRPQDPECLLAGIEEFSNTNWFNSVTVGIRLLDTKETQSKNMDRDSNRKASKRKQGRMSALIAIDRPKPHPSLPLPPYFDIIGAYNERRGSPPNSPKIAINLLMHGVLTQLALPPFFVGDKKAFGLPIKRSTISAETKRLLVGCGAIPKGPPLQAEHIRHTALPHVESRCPGRLPEAIARARNSMRTFEKKYRTPIAPEQSILMKKLPAKCQLELIMLG